MDIVTLFILRLLAVVYLAVGIGMFANGDHYRKHLAKVTSSHSFLYLGGLVSLVAGFSIVTFLSGEGPLGVLLTIFGWIALAKGVLVLAFPEQSIKFSEMMVTKKNFKLYATMALVLGLLFGYLGFIM